MITHLTMHCYNSLSAQSTDEQLQDDVTEHFGQWGPILSVKVSRDWMNRPFAFVQYEVGLI